jgi:hypothetical protein
MSPSSVQVVRITLDGTELPQDRIPLMDDRREHVADVYLD